LSCDSASAGERGRGRQRDLFVAITGEGSIGNGEAAVEGFGLLLACSLAAGFRA
jgi:hypothetical protein